MNKITTAFVIFSILVGTSAIATTKPAPPLALHLAVIDGSVLTIQDVIRLNGVFRAANPDADVTNLWITYDPRAKSLDLNSAEGFSDDLTKILAKSGAVSSLLIQANVTGSGHDGRELKPFGPFNFGLYVGAVHFWRPLWQRLAPNAKVSLLGSAVGGSNYDSLAFARRLLCYFGAPTGRFCGLQDPVTGMGLQIRVSNAGFECATLQVERDSNRVFSCEPNLENSP